MKTINFRKLGPAVLAALLATPFAANAESDFASGAGAIQADARVDFQITIERFLSLRVGSPGAAIDLIQFTVPAADVGNGVDVAGTGGNVANNGAVTVAVSGNGGDIFLTATTLGALNNGALGTIDWSQVSTAVAGAVPAPTLQSGVTSPSVTVNSVNDLVNENATWTYTYLNDNVVPAGTYGGALGNGRVTYTASYL